LVIDPSVAEIVDVRFLSTGTGLIVKAALELPAATVTVPPGSLACAALELLIVTTTPPVGAAPVSCTVPVDEKPGPPKVLVGFTVSELSTGGIKFRVAVTAFPAVAVIVTLALLLVPVVVIVNVPVLLPAETVIVDGTDASVVLLEDKGTGMPPVGAAMSRVTVPVTVAPPPAMPFGEMERETA